MTTREWVTAVVLGLIVTALLFDLLPGRNGRRDRLGRVRGRARIALALAVWSGLVAGLGAVASDLVANRELVGFHLAVTFTMCALAWSAWSITGRLIRADHRG